MEDEEPDRAVHAAWRLKNLIDFDVLTEDEICRFKEEFWRRFSNEEFVYAFLNCFGWPELIEIPGFKIHHGGEAMARSLVKDSLPLTLRSTEGGTELNMGTLGSLRRRLSSLRQVLRRVPIGTDAFEDSGLRQFAHELNKYLRNRAQGLIDHSFSDIVSPKMLLLELSLCFREILDSTELQSDVVREHLALLNNFDLPVSHMFPWPLSGRASDGSAHYLNTLERDFESHSELRNLAACYGFSRWVRQMGDERFPTIPEELVRMITELVRDRRLSGFEYVLDTARLVLGDVRVPIDDRTSAMLAESLERLAQETRMSEDSIWRTSQADSESNLFPHEARPTLRWKAAKLAASLAKRDDISNEELSGLLEIWKERASSSNLPELQRVWDEL